MRSFSGTETHDTSIIIRHGAIPPGKEGQGTLSVSNSSSPPSPIEHSLIYRELYITPLDDPGNTGEVYRGAATEDKAGRYEIVDAKIKPTTASEARLGFSNPLTILQLAASLG